MSKNVSIYEDNNTILNSIADIENSSSVSSYSDQGDRQDSLKKVNYKFTRSEKAVTKQLHENLDDLDLDTPEGSPILYLKLKDALEVKPKQGSHNSELD